MILDTNRNCKNCALKTPIFNFLAEEELEEIDKNRVEVIYNPGEIIVKQGSPSTHVLSFSSGLAKIYTESPGKNPLIISLIKTQGFIANPGISVNDRHIFSVRAIEKSMVCAIDKNIFQRILSANTKFSDAFHKIENENYKNLLVKLIDLNHKQSKGKVASTLLYLADEIYCSNPFTPTISVIEIADFTGMSKESTFKALKEFSDSGIITISKKSIEILSRELLTRISEMG